MEDLDWQPRETAPKTGEQLLVKDHLTYAVVQWKGGTFLGLCNEEHSYDIYGDHHVVDYFTHWYPLEKQKAHPQSRG